MKVVWRDLTKEELNSSFVNLRGKLGKYKEGSRITERLDIPNVLTRRYLYSKEVSINYGLGEYLYDAESSIIMGYVDEEDLPIIFEEDKLKGKLEEEVEDRREQFNEQEDNNGSMSEYVSTNTSHSHNEFNWGEEEDDELPWEEDGEGENKITSTDIESDEVDIEEEDDELPWEEEEEDELPWEEEEGEEGSLDGYSDYEVEVSNLYEDEDDDDEEPWEEQDGGERDLNGYYSEDFDEEEEEEETPWEDDEGEEEPWIDSEDESDTNVLVEDVEEFETVSKPNEEVKAEVPNKVSLHLTMEDDDNSLDFINKIVNKENNESTEEKVISYTDEVKEEDEKLKDLPLNPIEFLRRYPRSKESDVKKYYSSKEVDKYIDRGLIQVARGKLFI